ncbi:Uncharacterised protein [Escherichia coli]|nr:Uncharacterised protein [Escherichia coli]STJ87038.1 Uncharacterised protein [Escherichia coli]
MDTIITWMGDRLLGGDTKIRSAADGDHWINFRDLFNNFVH